MLRDSNAKFVRLLNQTSVERLYRHRAGMQVEKSICRRMRCNMGKNQGTRPRLVDLTQSCAQAFQRHLLWRSPWSPSSGVLKVMGRVCVDFVCSSTRAKLHCESPHCCSHCIWAHSSTSRAPHRSGTPERVEPRLILELIRLSGSICVDKKAWRLALAGLAAWVPSGGGD